MNNTESKSATSLFDLSGKVALVTGASSGIGAHAAQILASAGCKVVLCARRVDRLEQTADALTTAGLEADFVAMDVNKRQSIEQAVSATVEKYGALDILLNNAGVAAVSRFCDMSDDDWNKVIDTNLSGVWRVAQIVSKQMLAKGSGSIINIASVLGLSVQRQQSNYCASKAGVIQLTKSMALELGRKGIRVNAIAPGYFITDINRDFFQTGKGEEFLRGLFPGRAGELHELNGPLLLLASNAGSYINGSVLTVDGGGLLTGF